MMKSNTNLRNGVRAALIAIAVLFLMGLFSQEVFAAGKITIKYDPGEVTLEDTTFSLYKVGHFGTNGVFVFDDAYTECGIEAPNYKIDEEGSEDAWREKWMDSAKALSEYIKDNGIEPYKEMTVTDAQCKAGFSFDGGPYANGFYLIVGTSTKIVDGADITYYWPRPMYIRVLNDDPEYELKTASGLAKKLKVIKHWEGDEEVMELSRPETITIHTSYKGEEREEYTLPDKDGNWYVEWETEMGEDDPDDWSVTEDFDDEKLKQNYEMSITDQFVEENGELIKTITNKYARTELEIKKILEDYISHPDGSTQSFVFKVECYAGDDMVYSRFATVLFSDESSETNTTLVRGIRADVTRIEVTEVDPGNYTPRGEVTKEADPPVADDEKKVWKVSFTNYLTEGDNPPPYNTGVINKYSITGESAFKFEKKIGK